MGIPRLSQDVAPYAESATLGKHTLKDTKIQVTNLVIDGPSLVYHVYNALLGYRSSFISGVGVLPTYTQINACFVHFLQHLAGHGVQVAIVFDGGLPVSKRPVRQERLEKTRQNLDKYYRLQLPGNNSTSLNSAMTQSEADGRSESDMFKKALWGTNVTTSGQHHLLPPPPFMAASVFESLMQSHWSNVTHIVPGEADAYCASIAAASGSAVLSNDSDLLLYNLGPAGKVVLLRTLELSCHSNHDRELLSAQCLRPLEIAKQMDIPDLLTYGFYRSRDSSSSTSIIVNRSRGQMAAESMDKWNDFKRDYEIMNINFNNHVIAEDNIFCALKELDTRVAELVCSLRNTESIHMYLPTVLEDPTRDSAWSYGVDLREIAYSILFYGFSHSRHEHNNSYLTEYGRKGPHTAKTQVQCISKASLITKIGAIVDKLAQYLEDDTRDEDPGNHGIKGKTNRSKVSSTAATILSYYLFAADIVIVQRLARSKTYEPSFSRLFQSTGKQYRPSPTWDDIHFHTTIVCTVYSLRILSQITNFVMKYQKSHVPNEMHNVLQNLLAGFNTIPTIASLFSDVASLPKMVHNAISPTLLARRVLRIISDVDAKTPKRPDEHPNKRSGGRNQSRILSAPINNGRTSENRWQEAHPKSRKNVTKTPTIDSLQRRGTKKTEQHANSFALLQGSMDDCEG